MCEGKHCLSCPTHNKGLDFSWCRNPDVGLPRPDAVIFLDISEEVACTRAGYGKERYEEKEMQHCVRHVFNKLKEIPKEKDDWRVLDASESLEDVQEAIMKIVLESITNAQSSPLRTL
ncbi:Thymidylate kinase [Neolecta irregularis DAH-3]|uniref:Thymidylate kinase n=1 Tax=Neolecta irregularis (strain DAH-3) TaxID=1198029 RepID=A0A1U7LUJ4_NEOID|nr:Thymidylate kinase [Neolecta irregularis DAH-3]|eukprot:OLL26346.1 Thymidylate kinase [Neolecta irregularis DAH-3]